MTMRQVKEEVCLYYMGFGICARGLYADKKGCCAGCSQYKASGVKIGKKSKVVTGKRA
jgi:hypothetical protein